MELPLDIPSCHALILQQAEEMRVLLAQVSELNKRLELLEGRLDQNSRNSHRPPSSDGLTKQPALPRKPKGKKGGQQGHKGRTLKMVETPDVVINVYPSVCTCGADLSGTENIVLEKRQVFDLPPKRLMVTEYRQYGGYCPCCEAYQSVPFPKGVSAPVQYGAQVKALCVLLATEYRTPFRKIEQWFKDVYCQAVNAGSISSFLEDCHQRLAPVETKIRTKLKEEVVAHFDETGIRCSGKLYWLHTASSSMYTLLFVHTKRGLEALKSTSSVLEGFSCWAVHNCWGSYFNLGLKKQALCMAHIIRELVGLSERGSRWAPHMRRLLLLLYKMTDNGHSCLDAKQLGKAQKVYARILEYADSQEPLPVKNNKGRFKATKGRNLLRRLTELEPRGISLCQIPRGSVH